MKRTIVSIFLGLLLPSMTFAASVSIFFGLLLPSMTFAASTKEDLQARIDSAKIVLDQILAAPDNSIPTNILKQATCVAIVPGMIKGAFVFGAQYGQGVVTCRTGHGWSGPVFIRMAGGSFGFQIGGQATDLILIAVNDRGLQDLLKNKFKIGADASAAAGPVGRAGQAATDWKMSAELLSYSRAKGLFAGISLDGTSVSQNTDDTDVYYGNPQHFEAVLRGNVPVPPGAVPFVRDVAQHFVNAKAAQ
jgi:lipid-binding SYLF domain-containing protein